MPIITDKINKIIKEKNYNVYQISKIMDFSDGALRKMISTESPFSEKAIKKLIPILEVSKEEFEGWIIADKYPKDALKLAIQIKTDFPYKRKSVLTVKIDKILEEKGISRTSLAKEIKYSQSGLNAIIIRKRSMSKPVLEKIAKALEIPENEITSWILADKYSLQTLETAYSCINT